MSIRNMTKDQVLANITALEMKAVSLTVIEADDE